LNDEIPITKDRNTIEVLKKLNEVFERLHFTRAKGDSIIIVAIL